MESSAKITHNQPKSPKKNRVTQRFRRWGISGAACSSRSAVGCLDQKTAENPWFSVWFGGFPYFFSESNARRMCIYIYTIVDLTIKKEDVMWIGQANRVFSLGESCRRYERTPDATACMGFYSISMAIIGHDGNPPFNDSSLRSSIQLLLDCKSPYFTVVADSITSVLVLPLPVAKSRSFWLNHYVWLNFSWVHTPFTARPISTARGTSTAVMTTARQRPRFSRQVPWRYHGDVMGIETLWLWLTVRHGKSPVLMGKPR